MLPKIVTADFQSLMTVNEHERDLSILKTKASRYFLLIPPMHKSEREFVREAISWKIMKNVS